MTIDIEFEEYDEATVDAGIILILHIPEERPVKAKGIQISPGFKTHVLVAETKVSSYLYSMTESTFLISRKYYIDKILLVLALSLSTRIRKGYL